MSEPLGPGPLDTGRPPRGGLRVRIVSGVLPFLGLVLLWMLIWGQFTWLSLITGALLGLLVSIVFYLPAVRLSGHINIFRGAVFFGRLLVDIVSASLQIAFVALQPRYTPSNAIIAVPLRTRSDLIMTLTSVAVALVPGSIVLDIDRETATLYLHALNVRSIDEVPALKRGVLATERRLILTAGTLDDLQRLRDVEAGVGSARHDRLRDDERGEGS